VLIVTLASATCEASAAVNSIDLDLYGRLLERHTRVVADTAGTRVDYAALRADPEWRRLLEGLAAAPQPAASAAQNERLAYWINAYNMLAIDMVVRNQPVASIRDIGSLLRPVWKRDAGKVGGRAVTLDEVEHAILRPIGDPRVHVAIVCASTSCPSLPREPFRTERLDAQLDAAARAFIANTDKGARAESRSLRVSKIFQWFGRDFAARDGVIGFVRRHASPELRTAIDQLGPKPDLTFFDYDWSLNGIGRPS
jgi:hypothetical protein